MRILLHDYCGHAFIVELGRKLAASGHDVLHLYSKSFVTPQGDMENRDEDTSFSTVGLTISGTVQKESFLKRRTQEQEHGRLVSQEIEKFHPDIVVCANTPLEAYNIIRKTTKSSGAKSVFWCQDINGIAIKAIVGRALPVVGSFIGDYYIGLETRLLKGSDVIIAISEDFKTVFKSMGVDHPRTYVLPNWAPLDQLPAMPRQNDWSKKNGLDKQFVFLYSGTLGMKHNPELLARLAESFEGNDNVTVLVISEGKAANWLREQAEVRKLSRLKIMPFQPFSEVPSVFGTADVLIAILEPSAAEFSVPSKVLAYLCAARPLLLAVPKINLVARIVDEAGAGLVVSPEDADAFVAAAKKQYEDAALRKSQSKAARDYAETTFNLDSVSKTFEGFMVEAAGTRK